jgi:beta-mannosidase
MSQLMQSEAVVSAYSTWRRNWKGPNKEYSAGALVWQLNDTCTWPVTSWAIVDYLFVRPAIPYLTY